MAKRKPKAKPRECLVVFTSRTNPAVSKKLFKYLLSPEVGKILGVGWEVIVFPHSTFPEELLRTNTIKVLQKLNKIHYKRR